MCILREAGLVPRGTNRWIGAATFALLLLPACGAHTPSKGGYVDAPGVQIAAAAPTSADPLHGCGIRATRETLLREVNAARAKGRTCGGRRLPPASPLVWNDALFSAAARHSMDMANRDYFAHASPEGNRVGARVTAQGYAWRSVGENIAGGDRSVEVVVRGWMDSPGHCANIMNGEFNEIGAACVERPNTTWGTYWTMVLGRRR